MHLSLICDTHAYRFAVGVAALFWGPFADYYGRSLTYWVSMAGFLATTLVCIFAPNIGVLIFFRALQGCCIASTVTIGNAVVADIFTPEKRGMASGVFLIPLVGVTLADC
jgi:MFS family permease